jgi:hypothetical protein
LDLGRFPEARYLGEFGGQYLRSSEVNTCLKCQWLEFVFVGEMHNFSFLLQCILFHFSHFLINVSRFTKTYLT